MDDSLKMSIRAYNLLVFALTLFGGLGLALMFAWSASNNKASILAVSATEISVEKIDAIAQRLDVILTTADLAIGGRETYTAKWAAESAYQLMADIAEIDDSESVAEYLDIREFADALERLNKIIMLTVSETDGNALLSQFDSVANDAIIILNNAQTLVRREADRAITNARAMSQEVRTLQYLAATAFAILTLGLSVFGANFLVRPLEGIRRAADAEEPDIILENTFALVPKEISQLAGSLRGFLLNLDDTVKARTKELRAQTIRLEEEVNQRRLTEIDLSVALEEAQQASRAKSEFLSVTSHELRTPLNTIMATLDLIDSPNLDDEQRRFCELARRSGSHLAALLGDILEYSTIESGNVDIKPVRTLLPEFFADLVGQSESLCRASDVQLVPILPSHLPSVAVFDAGRLRQVVDNFIGNAIKYAGGSPVTLKVVFQDGERSSLAVTVSDRGPGIRADLLEDIFDPFSQVDASLSRESAGVGLGLALCRLLARAMSGDIYVESQLGVGSSFTVSIPVEVIEGEAQNDELPPHASPDMAVPERAILLVEDSEVNRMLTTVMLEREGFLVSTADDGYAALEQCSTRRFDLILMDLQMPGIDGFETALRIKKSDGFSAETPIVCLSANIGKEFKARASEVGMVGFIEKPITKATLLKVVSATLESSR